MSSKRFKDYCVAEGDKGVICDDELYVLGDEDCVVVIKKDLSINVIIPRLMEEGAEDLYMEDASDSELLTIHIANIAKQLITHIRKGNKK